MMVETLKDRVDSAMRNPKTRSTARKAMASDILKRLETGVLGRIGVRPAQTKAVAKQIAMNESAASLRLIKAGG